MRSLRLPPGPLPGPCSVLLDSLAIPFAGSVGPGSRAKHPGCEAGMGAWPGPAVWAAALSAPSMLPLTGP